jgi:anti-anti-sigma factor
MDSAIPTDLDRVHRRPFTVTADGRRSGVLHLAGDLDIASATVLEAAGNAALDEGPADLVLDCGELPFLDSSGLRALVRLRDRAARVGGRLGLVHVNRRVEAVLRVSGLEDLVDAGAARPRAQLASRR